MKLVHCSFGVGVVRMRRKRNIKQRLVLELRQLYLFYALPLGLVDVVDSALEGKVGSLSLLLLDDTL